MCGRITLLLIIINFAFKNFDKKVQFLVLVIVVVVEGEGEEGGEGDGGGTSS